MQSPSGEVSASIQQRPHGLRPSHLHHKERRHSAVASPSRAGKPVLVQLPLQPRDADFSSLMQQSITRLAPSLCSKVSSMASASSSPLSPQITALNKQLGLVSSDPASLPSSLSSRPQNMEIVLLLGNQSLPPAQQRHPPQHHGLAPRDPQRRRLPPRPAPHVALPHDQVRRPADAPRDELDAVVGREQVGVKGPDVRLVDVDQSKHFLCVQHTRQKQVSSAQPLTTRWIEPMSLPPPLQVISSPNGHFVGHKNEVGLQGMSKKRAV
ncbi:hypothetical protein CCMA1212_004719 [Trichoderma ghanense]|uniref:Uncharacterized protein n=1 Tax=Trichoderma ghanense TaxID=65468 RepID=A0ABY2H4M8_9HYPO